MGLTLHFQGQLRSESAYADFLAAAHAFAAAHAWPVHPVADPHRELLRTLQPEDPQAAEVEELYTGPVRGLLLLPHPLCEPLAFEFDTDLFMQDQCKTQFAGPEVHAAVCRLFRATEPLFDLLDVQDEAEFWEAGESPETLAALAHTFATARAAIEEAAAEDPGAAIAVVTPSGRILDILAA